MLVGSVTTAHPRTPSVCPSHRTRAVIDHGKTTTTVTTSMEVLEMTVVTVMTVTTTVSHVDYRTEEHEAESGRAIDTEQGVNR